MTSDPDDWADPRLAALYDLAEGDRPDLGHYEAIVDELGARSVLDVGCGTGLLALRLARRGLRVTGLDPSRPMLDVARRYPDAELVEWVRGTTSDLADVAVDLAVMTGNVAQVFVTDDAWRSSLDDLAAAISPGGHLVFESRVPARRAWEQWTPEHTRRRMRAEDGHVETWCEVLEVDEPFVTFRWTYQFESDGAVTTRDSTLRFRERDEIERSLDEAGFAVVDVRDAPDRPGNEWVFVARRR